jgi:hypothetical protein
VDNLQFRRLNPLECDSLIKPFSMEEVKAVVRDCDNYKSTGPYDNYEFHRNDKLSKSLNSTFIALLPKVDNPQHLNDFRPISLVVVEANSLFDVLKITNILIKVNNNDLVIN